MNVTIAELESYLLDNVRVRRKSPKSVSRKQPILVKRKSP